MSLSDKLSSLRATLTGEEGPVGPSAVSPSHEQDEGHDPRTVASRATGGEHEEFEGDQGSVTGTGDTDVHVGQIAGDDLGYAQETGAEARREAAGDQGER